MFEWLKDFVPLGNWDADDTSLICLKNKLLIKSNLMLKTPITKSKSHIEQNTCQIQNIKNILIAFTKTSSIMLHLRCRTPPSLFREKKNKTTTKNWSKKFNKKIFFCLFWFLLEQNNFNRKLCLFFEYMYVHPHKRYRQIYTEGTMSMNV